MSQTNPYKVAYERERQARILAEKLLDEKTRRLYENCATLEQTLKTLENTQGQLIQAEKLVSLGQLAAGVAHEINNPIGFSLSNLTTLKDYIQSLLSLDALVLSKLPSLDGHPLSQSYQQLRQEQDIDFILSDIQSLLAETTGGLHRVSQIVTNLRRVSHSGELEKEQQDIHQLIEESMKVVWNELKYHLEVKRDFASLPKIACHSSEMHQVLINMFLNAAHACEGGGCLLIKTYLTQVQHQDFIAIDICDNGKGMSKATCKKIFDPFFTTKPVGKGTGLGLSIAFAIIEKHQGKITVSSDEGKGTTFTICLPVAPPESNAPDTA
ncbi:sensor histidine kinase [Thalassomonas actiniarum]|uniref:histidine kinase n=1 Tax=Thalassomonas actiniarum TaxID=485447 RepID=A0AAE9YTQ7_9GAMM|nr:ATP-binding protein [Thalassomonas actiniarum]WDE01031.1 histidine kinase [Thalassomonas actiniarum]